GLSRDAIPGHNYLPAECPRTARVLRQYGELVKPRRRPPLAPLAPHQPRPARDVAYALERGGMVAGPSRAQASARAAERDPARGGSLGGTHEPGRHRAPRELHRELIHVTGT